MVVTVFRSRLKPGVETAYMQCARRLGEIARAMQGYVSHKAFVAEDGERVIVVEFESQDTQRAWARHPEHLEAQKLARQQFYLEYRAQICHVQEERKYP